MDGKQLQTEWNSICERMKTYDSISENQMNAFFSRIVPQAMSDGFLMVTAENDFIKTWIERHYVDYIKQALKELKGMDYEVAIEVDTSQSQSKTMPAATPQNIQHEETHRPEQVAVAQAPREPMTTEGSLPYEESMDKLEAQEGLIDSRVFEPTSTLTFENFVIGESNKLAYSMAVSVAEQPGRLVMNPLFLYGKSGLGKTHLMRAIQNYINATYPEMKTVYVDANHMSNQYIQASIKSEKEKTSFMKFRMQYEDVDVLLVDDIQELQDKRQTLDIFFQIFNSLINQGKQIVLSADRAPKNIDIDERYSSRFNSGVTADIQPPSMETKLGIIIKYIEEYNQLEPDKEQVDLPDDVKKYIAENSGSNIRELKSAVTRVIMYMMEKPEPHTVTIQEVEKELEDHFSGGSMRKLTIPDIQKAVEEYYKVSHADLIGKKRNRNIAYARQVAIYLSRHMLDLPYNTIAESFGGKDHTTIMYSVTNVEKKVLENRQLREELETIKRIIREE